MYTAIFSKYLSKNKNKRILSLFIDGVFSPYMDMLAVDPCAAIPQLNHFKNKQKELVDFEEPVKEIELVLHVKHDRYDKKQSASSEEPSNGIQITAGNKKFLCPKCNRGFTLKPNCLRHFKFECGLEPRYKCPYCEIKSKQTSRIYSHIRKKHPGKDVCVVNIGDQKINSLNGKK